jgi:hypothetical protein
VQQDCKTHGDCFCEEGWKCDDFWDYKTDHDVDCECEPISAHDMIGFSDDDCSCRIKDKVENPEEDIEKRIIEQVEETIAGLLSDIVNKCF